MKKYFAKLILNYFRFLTRRYLAKYNIKVVGLTGSSGKSTLTLSIYSILSKQYKVGMTYKDGHGLNSESGVPFAVLNVHVSGYSIIDWIIYLYQGTLHYLFTRPDYEIFIMEMGVDKPGDMDFLLSMVSDINIGIFLSASPVHGKNFESLLPKEQINAENILNLIINEKSKLIKALHEDSFALLNNDDPRITILKDMTKAKTITFGLSDSASIKGRIVNVTPEIFTGEVFVGNKTYTLQIKNYFVNRNNFLTLLASIAVGNIYQIPVEKSIAALEEFIPPPGRMTKVEGIRDSIIIDSSYNSAPLSMIEALDNLALFSNRKRIAILGDMREIGEASQIEHEKLAEYSIKIADEIVTVGPMMKNYFLPKALELGFPKDKIISFDNTYKALAFVRDTLIAGGEAILVKGSQNTLLMEIIVEGLMKSPETADKILCRRGEYWDKMRLKLMSKN